MSASQNQGNPQQHRRRVARVHEAGETGVKETDGSKQMPRHVGLISAKEASAALSFFEKSEGATTCDATRLVFQQSEA